MQPKVFLLLGANLQFLYQIQMDHFLNTFLHHSKTKIKGFVVILHLMLLFLNRIYEQNPRMTTSSSFSASKSGLRLSLPSSISR